MLIVVTVCIASSRSQMKHLRSSAQLNVAPRGQRYA